MQGAGTRGVRILAAAIAVLALVHGGAAHAAKRTASRAPAGPLQASIVVDGATGEILQAANAEQRSYPASLTKMMTLYLAFDALKAKKLALHTKLRVSQHAAQQSPTKLYLEPGETIETEDAVMGLVTKSANDAAVVIAETLGGTEDNFARLMTKKARELGMTETVFQNASGLPDRGQVTTARDLVILAMSLYRDHPEYYHYFGRQAFEYRGVVHGNHNKLLGRYDGVDGIKTGYIKDSGFNLAASAERNGRRLFAVVMGGTSGYARDIHMAALLDKSFQRLPSTEMAALSPKSKFQRVAANGKLLRQPKPAMPQRIQLAAASPVAVAVDAQGDQSIPKLETHMDASPSTGSWGVQVGAYQRFVQAQLAASRAANTAREPLKGASILVVPVELPKGMLYRARLTGVTKEAAEEACRVLVQHQFDCAAMEIPPGAELAETVNETDTAEE